MSEPHSITITVRGPGYKREWRLSHVEERLVERFRQERGPATDEMERKWEADDEAAVRQWAAGLALDLGQLDAVLAGVGSVRVEYGKLVLTT